MPPAWTVYGGQQSWFWPPIASKNTPQTLWHPEVPPTCFLKLLLEVVVPICQKTSE